LYPQRISGHKPFLNLRPFINRYHQRHEGLLLKQSFAKEDVDPFQKSLGKVKIENGNNKLEKLQKAARTRTDTLLSVTGNYGIPPANLHRWIVKTEVYALKRQA
jgi:hypothetical protein